MSDELDLSAWLERYRALVEPALEIAIEQIRAPERLAEAMRHAVLGGGKRLRPVLCLATAELIGGEQAAEHALPVACALELIHAYSLVHDDLPAMDDDELRRGRPTVHVAFGEADAILAGDALNTEAFGLIARAHRIPADRRLRCIDELAAAAGGAGMVGGQHLDLAAENRNIPAEQLTDLARRKTGALLSAACVTGGIIAGASDERLEAIRRYGAGIGLAFQIADDVIDVEGTAEHVGKKTAKDRSAGKSTFPELLGVDGARARARELVADAVDALAPWGEAARGLTSVARFVVERTR